MKRAPESNLFLKKNNEKLPSLSRGQIGSPPPTKNQEENPYKKSESFFSSFLTQGNELRKTERLSGRNTKNFELMMGSPREISFISPERKTPGGVLSLQKKHIVASDKKSKESLFTDVSKRTLNEQNEMNNFSMKWKPIHQKNNKILSATKKPFESKEERPFLEKKHSYRAAEASNMSLPRVSKTKIESKLRVSSSKNFVLSGKLMDEANEEMKQADLKFKKTISKETSLNPSNTLPKIQKVGSGLQSKILFSSVSTTLMTFL